MIRAIIADDHPLVREGLKHILAECPDIELGAEANDGSELISALRQGEFDVILLDMFMPGRSGIELIKQLKSEFATTPIIVLSTHKEDIFALRTLKAGASGYLCKDYAASGLIDAIRKVFSGGLYISPAVAELMAQELHAPSSPDVEPHTLLSDREHQVFLLVANGLGSSEIAEQLHLSVKTVSTHKARIKEKMKLQNSAEFTRYALKHGLIEESDS